MELRETVREVREYIEEHGWHQDDYGVADGDGAVCIWGAYGRVTNIAFDAIPELANKNSSLAGSSSWVAVQEFRRAVGDGLPAPRLPYIDPIVEFNDNPETTVEDVLLHLKRVEGTL